MVSPFGKKTPSDQDQDLVKKIMKEGKDVKAFGGGAASNVIRFFMRETGKGSETRFVQSKPVGTKGQVDYAFYARMNMCSAAGFAAVREFYQLVTSHVSSTATWTTWKGSGMAKAIVPRILLNVERTQPAFQQLYAWMRSCHTKAGKEFNDAPFSSITIVEGARSEPLDELLCFQGKWPNNMQNHAMELGLTHAIDVAVGMGDRLQTPNIGNVTLHPETLQMVVIDVDSFLPPKGQVKKCIEDACLLKTADCMGPGDSRKNEAWVSHTRSWPPCPPRLPLQGNYAASVSAALDEDWRLWVHRVSLGQSEIASGSHGGKPICPGAASAFNGYYKLLQLPQTAETFKRATTYALKEIRTAVCDGRFALKVEDITCSGARLKERVNQWKFA